VKYTAGNEKQKMMKNFFALVRFHWPALAAAKYSYKNNIFPYKIDYIYLIILFIFTFSRGSCILSINKKFLHTRMRIMTIKKVIIILTVIALLILGWIMLSKTIVIID